MPSKNLNRIQKHEKVLNKFTEGLNQLEEVLRNMESLQPGFKALMDYYGSEAWNEDVAISEKPGFINVPCGVLSQDTVYDLYQKQRKLHFESIRLALNYLE